MAWLLAPRAHKASAQLGRAGPPPLLPQARGMKGLTVCKGNGCLPGLGSAPLCRLPAALGLAQSLLGCSWRLGLGAQLRAQEQSPGSPGSRGFGVHGRGEGVITAAPGWGSPCMPCRLGLSLHPYLQQSWQDAGPAFISAAPGKQRIGPLAMQGWAQGAAWHVSLAMAVGGRARSGMGAGPSRANPPELAALRRGVGGDEGSVWCKQVLGGGGRTIIFLPGAATGLCCHDNTAAQRGRTRALCVQRHACAHARGWLRVWGPAMELLASPASGSANQGAVASRRESFCPGVAGWASREGAAGQGDGAPAQCNMLRAPESLGVSQAATFPLFYCEKPNPSKPHGC